MVSPPETFCFSFVLTTEAAFSSSMLLGSSMMAGWDAGKACVCSGIQPPNPSDMNRRDYNWNPAAVIVGLVISRVDTTFRIKRLRFPR